jgi:hypothetical protein
MIERQGGVWKSEGFLMKGSGILLKSFGFRIADSEDRGFPVDTAVMIERQGGGKGEPWVPPINGTSSNIKTD